MKTKHCDSECGITIHSVECASKQGREHLASLKKKYYIQLLGETYLQAINNHNEPFVSIKEALDEAFRMGTFNQTFHIIDVTGNVHGYYRLTNQGPVLISVDVSEGV